MAFSRSVTGLSHVPSFYESILGVTVESVQGNQVYLECTAILGGTTSGVPLDVQFESTSS